MKSTYSVKQLTEVLNEALVVSAEMQGYDDQNFISVEQVKATLTDFIDAMEANQLDHLIARGPDYNPDDDTFAYLNQDQSTWPKTNAQDAMQRLLAATRTGEE